MGARPRGPASRSEGSGNIRKRPPDGTPKISGGHGGFGAPPTRESTYQLRGHPQDQDEEEDPAEGPGPGLPRECLDQVPPAPRGEVRSSHEEGGPDRADH